MKCPKCKEKLIKQDDIYICSSCGKKFKPKEKEGEKERIQNDENLETSKSMPKEEGVPGEQNQRSHGRISPAVFIVGILILLTVAALIIILTGTFQASAKGMSKIENISNASEGSATKPEEPEETEETVRKTTFIDPFDAGFFNVTGGDGVMIDYIGASPNASIRIRNSMPHSDPRADIIYTAEPAEGIRKGEEVKISAELGDTAKSDEFALAERECYVTCDSVPEYVTDIEQITDDVWEKYKQDAIASAYETIDAIKGTTSTTFKRLDINGSNKNIGFYNNSNITNIRFVKAYLFSKKPGLEDYDNFIILEFTCDKTDGKNEHSPAYDGVYSYAITMNYPIVLESDGTVRYEPGKFYTIMTGIYTEEEYFELYCIEPQRDQYDITEKDIDWIVENG